MDGHWATSQRGIREKCTKTKQTYVGRQKRDCRRVQLGWTRRNPHQGDSEKGNSDYCPCKIRAEGGKRGEVIVQGKDPEQYDTGIW